MDLYEAEAFDQRLLALFGVRVAVLLVLLWTIVRVVRIRDDRRFRRAVVILSWIAVMMLFAIHLLRPPGQITHYFVETVLIFALYTVFPLRTEERAAPAFSIAAGGILLAFLWHDSFTLLERVGAAFALILANAVGLTVSWHSRWLDRRERALAAREAEARAALYRTTTELQALQTIIPICSHCRKVRDEAGAWDGLEAYVRSNTESHFSHGICPDCVREHYGDFETA